MFDAGSGTPIVVVQPLQGRWEWTRPLLEGLALRNRVVSYSLCGDLGSERRAGAEDAFGDYVAQLAEVMDRARLEEAAIVGISFGGTVAVRFAAEFPRRVTRLVIASSPGPGWQPNPVQAGYVARPWRSLPAFAAGAVNRVVPEITAALDGWPARAAFAVKYSGILARYPAMPHLMARRVRLMQQLDLEADCRRIGAPTLVITGDRDLDRVVPVESTKRYLECIGGARYEMLNGTGHLGVLTQPRRFASVIGDFVNGSHS